MVSCELSRQMQELIGSYILMEEYFMREMFSKVLLFFTLAILFQIIKYNFRQSQWISSMKDHSHPVWWMMPSFLSRNAFGEFIVQSFAKR
jgi:hypothetical protein